MEKQQISNYEKVKENWRLKFLEMDQDALIQKFQLESDENALYLYYFSQKLRIDRKTGLITFVDREETPNFNTIMSVYNTFYYSIDIPVASGIMIPFREVKRASVFDSAYKATVLKEFQNSFSGRLAELEAACEKLGGVRQPQGDVGYRIPVFPFLDMVVLFWDADEEFDAQANMLFDSNITNFMHEENVVTVASDAVYYLTLEAGLPPKMAYGEA